MILLKLLNPVMFRDHKKLNRVIVFVPQKIHTGGDRYLLEIFNHMQCQGVQVEAVYQESSMHSLGGIRLMVDCLLANFRFFFRVKKLNNISNTILFEDYHLHPRLWLFNCLIKIFYRHVKIVVLMQLALFYHPSLKQKWMRELDKWIVRIFLNQSSLILTNSQFTRREVLSLGIDPDIVEVVHCGYEGVVQADKLKKQCVSEKKILFVGQCSEYKGIEYLIQAVSLIAAENIALDIVGNTSSDKKYFDYLQKIIKENKLQMKVRFHGHIKNKTILEQFYKNADIFVLPSLVEGFGIVILDAMSFKLPVVASEIGAIPELVRDGDNGLLVLPKNAAALAEAIKRLIDSPALCKQLGEAGYNFITENHKYYSWNKVSERALQAMEPLLNVSYKDGVKV